MQHSPPSRPSRLLAVANTFALFVTWALAPAAFATTPVDGNTSFAPVEDGISQVHITLTSHNGGSCVLDYDKAKAGPISFSVTNETATAITEVELLSGHRILGEKENLAPGLPTVSFSVKLGGGDYKIYCPGAKQEVQPFTVVGQLAERPASNVAKLLAKGTRGYAHYVAMQMDAIVTAVARLKQYIDAGKLDKARAQYPQARVFYERIESDVEGFVLPGYKITNNAGSLDYLIDMRASSLDPRVGWHGFHAIERDLFKFDTIDTGTKKLAAELLKNVKRLQKVVKTIDFKPIDLANGAAALLEEVLSTKVSGEEEAFSHFDLVDMAANVAGARQAFAFLKPGLKEIDPGLTKEIVARFNDVEAMLGTFRDPDVPGGYVRYTQRVRKRAAEKISRVIKSLQEPLSRLAEKVATAGIKL